MGSDVKANTDSDSQSDEPRVIYVREPMPMPTYKPNDDYLLIGAMAFVLGLYVGVAMARY